MLRWGLQDYPEMQVHCLWLQILTLGELEQQSWVQRKGRREGSPIPAGPNTHSEV